MNFWRSVLFGCLLLAALVGSKSGAKAWAGEKEKQHETFVIGPFKLGELVGKMKDGELLSAGNDGPSQRDIIRALNKAKIYIIEKKVVKDEKWIFVDDPKLALEGTMSFKLKDKQGKDFEIQLIQLDHVGLQTNYTRTPAFRGFHLNVELRTKSQFVYPHDKELVKALTQLGGKHLTNADLKGSSQTATWNIEGDDWYISYDVNGKDRWPTKACGPSSRKPADETEDRAVKAVEKRGGKVIRDEKVAGKPVVTVCLRDCLIRPGSCKTAA